MVLPALPGGAGLWEVTCEPWRGETEIFTSDEWVNRECQVDQLLAASAAPVRSTRLAVSTRASCRPAQIIDAGGGAATRSRSTLSDPVSADPAPASSGGPGRGPRGRGPPQVSARAMWPKARGNRRERASARSWRHCARSSVPREECPGGMPGAPHPGRGAAPVLRASPCSRAAKPGRGKVGGRGAPTPQSGSPQFGRAAARAPQPRPLSGPTGESDEAARCCMCATLTSARLVRFSARAPTAPRFYYPVRPSRRQLQRDQVSRGQPRFGGGSLHDVAPAMDQDKRTEGGPRAEVTPGKCMWREEETAYVDLRMDLLAFVLDSLRGLWYVL
ncbi:hypothetical protein NDU88_003999 [Pleurodeles waltl]|uniref:Uncharacterized protein n=1 Tax=Pleurodeles waltl TaxID=8319 RepID=A0AAV7LGU7_PLEWA|nr:hypothetical protein NDU88_003999 [Pleurodeles waltl]